MDADKKMISVLMCVYDEVPSFLRESIESILCQTYKHFEYIIVCDNPSNDKIINLLKEYADRDNRIKIHVNPQNIGLTKSLNVGLKLCNGKYVARMDADDVALPERFQKQIDFLEKHQTVLACSAAAMLIDEQGKIIGERHLTTNSRKIAVEALFSSQLIHPASMMHRIVDGKVISYDENLKYAQDFGLWSSFPIGSLANLNEILLLYRTTGNQISSLRRDEQIVCAQSVQLRNMERNGLVLNEKDKYIFGFLINGKDSPSVSQESVEKMIDIIMNTFKGKVSKVLLFNYLVQKYMWCLHHRGKSLWGLIYSLFGLSLRQRTISFKPALYALYIARNR